jgi:arylsulfatase A-like enzyme
MKRPNVVLIVSDDMGYSDLPRYGGRGIPTPNLDRLADGGVLFTQGYSTAPICTPSRIGLFTGRYQQRFGIHDMYGEPEDFRLFLGQSSLASRLKAAGYATGLVGKWHMGSRSCISGNDPGHPLEFGFDEYVGISWGMSSYVPGSTLYRNREAFPAPEYLTDCFGTEACAFIEREKDGPFFLMLAFNAVHAPLEAPGDDLSFLDAGGEFPGSPDRKTYAAMLVSMDRNIGRVLRTLEDLGLDGSTYVGFINDNGGGGNNTPPHTRNTACNAPLRGFKFDLYEGGVRVPMMLRGPGYPRGRVCASMASGMDFAPTLLRAAGVDFAPAEFDGIDLGPHLRGGAPPPHETLYWHNRRWDGPFRKQGPVAAHNRAIREGRWKMVRPNVADDGSSTPPWELYDLDRDIGEQHNLAPEWPDVVDDLGRKFDAWLAPMPRWPEWGKGR